MTGSQFRKYNLKNFIINAIEDMGYQKPTEIQEKVIPIVLRRESAIGQSQTGTGKTFAYILPILQKIDPIKKEVQAVITAPTRELANQIYHQILKITEYGNDDEEIVTRCYIGGTDKARSIEKLKIQPHIVVGTPSRINDLVQEKALFVHTAQMLVVDEADLMLDMGFILDVDKVASKMPSDLEMYVFSATIPDKLKPFLKKYMENPNYIHVEPQQVSASYLTHSLLPSRHRDKVELTYKALNLFNPYLAIVFTNTKKKADELADALLARGLKVGRIHGNLSPRDRKRIMKQIQNLDFQFIIATDLAARGIDIEGVSHIINFELPSDLDFYIHRVGRTARGGYSGTALTIYDQSDQDALNKLEKMGIQFKHVDIKNNEWIVLDDRNKRKKREKQTNDIDEKTRSLVQKPKKVKPGYKKKMQNELDKIKKRERRIQKKK